MISIEANIGAGKSTLLKLIKEKYNNLFNVINEPLEEWQKTDILKLFYEDQERWSYTFQSNAFITRIQKYEKECCKTLINLSERSVVSDHNIFAKMLRNNGKINDTEWELYERWYNWLVTRFDCKPKGIIYLRTDPKISFERLKKRSRSEESTIPLEYIQNVHKYHNEWLLNEKDIPVLILDVNADFEHNDVQFQTLVSQITGFIENPLTESEN